MAAPTAANFTVTIPEFYGQRMTDGRKTVVGTLGIGNGTDTYVTGGIPLPAIGAFGMTVTLDSLTIFGVNGLTSDYQATYNKTAHTLQLFEEESTAAGGPQPECDTAEAPAARVYHFVATGW